MTRVTDADGRLPVAVLGATGVVGQRLVRRLAGHPWFRVAYVAAGEAAIGRRFSDACAWRLSGVPHAGLQDLVVADCRRDPPRTRVAFSALDAATAREVESSLARAGVVVFSNAAPFRLDADVPLLVPEVNASALDRLASQRNRWGGAGGIVCNPNCTATILALVLAPLEQAFGVEAVALTTLQALSGAGWPGVAAQDALSNVIPYIAEEEEKVEEEIAKILGRADLRASATCTRVPVADGHTESVGVTLRGRPSPSEVRRVLAEWRPEIGALPTAPSPPIVVHDEADRPQPRLDVEAADGMSVHVGRIRRCPVLGIKLVALGHNAERGAAGGAVLNAELSFARGLLA